MDSSAATRVNPSGSGSRGDSHDFSDDDLIDEQESDESAESEEEGLYVIENPFRVPKLKKSEIDPTKDTFKFEQGQEKISE